MQRTSPNTPAETSGGTVGGQTDGGSARFQHVDTLENTGTPGGTNPGAVNPGGNPGTAEDLPVALFDDRTLGLPEDIVIGAALVLAVVALLVALRSAFGRTGSDGLPQPNYAAIVSAAAVILTLAVGASVFMTQMDSRVTQLEREVGISYRR